MAARKRAIRSLLLSAAAGLTWAGSVVSGQQQPPPQTPPPTFRSGVQLIEVDVRVFDQSGRFVDDLTPDDFEVIEDGRPQRLEAMYLVGSSLAPTTPHPGNPAALLPGPAATPEAPQTWVFVFDLNHLTPGGGFDRARKAVEDFIRDSFKDGDLAGIVAGDRMVNNRLTSVRAELLQAVKQVQPRNDTRTRSLDLRRDWPRLLDEEEAIKIARADSESIQRAVTRACTDDPDQCRFAESMVREKGRRLASEIQRSTLATLSTVNVLASGLSRIAGPKTVVLLSDGFAVQDIETTLRSVVGQSARAGARIYGIDVRGLNRAAPGGSIEQLQATDETGAPARFDQVADGPNSLAVDTGGMMIRNENNIGRALQRVADDAGRYYVLAYQPENTNFDGKYRQIQVRVKREGTRVRARRGYLALEPAKMLKAQPIRTPEASIETPANPPDVVPATVAPPEAVPPPEPPMPVNVSAEPAAGGTATAAPGTVRLRPDAEERVKALSAREGASPTTELASRGWDAYEKGDIETANVAFTEAAQRPDVRPWVLYALGMTQAGLGRPGEALTSWERVRQEVPDFEPVYMDLADTYAQTGDLTRSLAILRDGQRRWPSVAGFASAIGVIHVRRGALNEGIAELLRVTELTPDDPLGYLNLGRAYALRYHRGRRYVASQRRWVAPEADREKAIEAYRRCVEFGGPYARQASEELSLLEWSK